MMLRLIGWILVMEAAESARILAFLPFPMKSHHFAFQPIIDELCRRGHDVTYLTAVPMDKPHYNLEQLVVPNVLDELQKEIRFVEFGKMWTPMISRFFYKMGWLVLSDRVMLHPNTQRIIHSKEKFDLIFHEPFFVQEATSALQHKFNALGVAVQPLADSAWVNEFAGLPDNPSYMIDLKSHYTDKLDFSQRLHNTYQTLATTLVSYWYLRDMQKMMDHYFNYTGWEGRPGIANLLADQALILVNSHHAVGYSYPKAPHVKEVGGINLKPNKPLPQELQEFMDSATNGVVYFSLGSNINMSEVSSSKFFTAFSHTFAKLKERVLWKWTGDDYPKVPGNVLISKWFPQQDILAHKNMKLFITHGGLLSTIEAVHHGVPLIGIPFFADQVKNMRQIESAGYGIRMDLRNVSKVSVDWAVFEILNNPSYKSEALRRSAMFNDRVMKPVEEAVYWIEYVLKHGKALQPASAHMTWYQVRCLDIIGSLLLTFLITYHLVIVPIRMGRFFICKKMLRADLERLKSE